MDKKKSSVYYVIVLIHFPPPSFTSTIYFSVMKHWKRHIHDAMKHKMVQFETFAFKKCSVSESKMFKFKMKCNTSMKILWSKKHFISQWKRKRYTCISVFVFVLEDKITNQNPLHCYVFLINFAVSKLDLLSLHTYIVIVSLCHVHVSFHILHHIWINGECKYHLITCINVEPWELETSNP